MSLIAGNMVRIADPRNLAYGRIGQVLELGERQSRICFAESGLVQVVDRSSLEDISRVPVASFYLLVTIQVEIDQDVSYTQPCLAHGKVGQPPDELAHAVARSWHPNGIWDAVHQCVVVESLNLVVRAFHWSQKSATEYAELRLILDDCTPT